MPTGDNLPDGAESSSASAGAADTRDGRLRLLEAGEELLGRYGVGAVSMRQIVAAAGQANPAAVQYHFKSMDGLIEAICRLRIPQVEERRKARLSQIPPDRLGDLRALLEAMITPYVEVLNSKGEITFAPFVSQMRFSDQQPAAWVTSDLAPVSEQLTQLIKNAMPPMPDDIRSVRLVLVFEVMHRAISPGHGGRLYGLDREAVLDEAITIAAAALRHA